MNGVVYAGFGSHCDIAPTNGWVIGVSTAGSITTLWSSEAGVDTGDGEGGIWSPGSLRSDGPGQLVFSPPEMATIQQHLWPETPTPGPRPLAEAVVRLTVQPGGSLKTTDFFIPLDAKALNQIDGDLGSGSPVLVAFGVFLRPPIPRLAVEIGKEGYLYVLNASNLGGYEQGANGSDNVLARLGTGPRCLGLAGRLGRGWWVPLLRHKRGVGRGSPGGHRREVAGMEVRRRRIGQADVRSGWSLDGRLRV